MCPPGPKCSGCCTIFSLWGIVTLIFMGIGFNLDYVYLDKGELDGYHGSSATASYIAAAIYGLFVVGCGTRFCLLSFGRRKSNKFVFEPE